MDWKSNLFPNKQTYITCIPLCKFHLSNCPFSLQAAVKDGRSNTRLYHRNWVNIFMKEKLLPANFQQSCCQGNYDTELVRYQPKFPFGE